MAGTGPPQLGMAGTGAPLALFHEKQRLMHCGLHAANNLLQTHAFDSSDFDRIARELPTIGSFFNPYKSVVPFLGNFDASVVLTALQEKGLYVKQHDRRRSAAGLQMVPHLRGLLVNVASPGFIKGMFRTIGIMNARHWIAVLAVRDDDCGTPSQAPHSDLEQCSDSVQFFNLDSNLRQPLAIPDGATLLAYLEHVLQRRGEIYIVTTQPDSEG